MSTVGNKGKGESIWLGFFLYKVLVEFIPLCEKMQKKNKDDNGEKNSMGKVADYSDVISENKVYDKVENQN